jgi:hypothetical protein
LYNIEQGRKRCRLLPILALPEGQKMNCQIRFDARKTNSSSPNSCYDGWDFTIAAVGGDIGPVVKHVADSIVWKLRETGPSSDKPRSQMPCETCTRGRPPSSG